MSKFIFYLLTFFLIGCFGRNTNTRSLNTQKVDTLEYSYRGFNKGFKLKLIGKRGFEFEDYVMGCNGGGEVKKVKGNYILNGLELTLKPEKVEHIFYPSDYQSEMKKNVIDYGEDSLKIKTKYDLFEWGKCKYLLSDELELIGGEYINDYHRFSEKFNAGIEPKKGGRYLKMTSKRTYQNSEKFPFDKIPLKWRKLFLDKPLVAEINKITISQSEKFDDLKIWSVEIDKGRKDNVRKNMTFLDEANNFKIEIDSVMEKNSFGKAYIYDFEDDIIIKEGSLLRTKLE